jgi:hypothetical protein
MSNSGTCGRSQYFINYCNLYGGGYDSQTCDCPDPSGACQMPAQGCYNELAWDVQVCDCMPACPIVVDVDGDGFDLTDAAGGVGFDITSDGMMEQLSWTAAGSDDAWLVLDRDGNGRIDNGRELFGNYAPQSPARAEDRHGFRALAEFDKGGNGGDGDGAISAADGVFGDLRLWRDANHNGVSEPEEMFTLPQLRLTEIRLDFRESGRTDRFGNRFKYRAKVNDQQGSRVGRWAWDVFLKVQNNASASAGLVPEFRSFAFKDQKCGSRPRA